MNIEALVKIKLEKIRPYINRHGGDVEFVKLEDGYAFVKLTGACEGCILVDDTLEFGIEELLVEEVPGIIGVVLVD